jgi:tRNA pseudouridine38-40 synthase
MPRYRLKIEYLGTHFSGWQSQPGGNTVQDVLEKAFTTCLRKKTALAGSGRTDAGVHAEGQVAHFDHAETIDIRKITNSVNNLTPDTVFIQDLEECSEDFHARYSAGSRYYQYKISLKPTALEFPLVWIVHYPLDIKLFSDELSCVIGKHDFKSFCIPRNDGKSTECEIFRADLELKEEQLIIHIEGNRFLHKMVRSIVGTCYDVARKHHSAGLIKAIFNQSFNGERTWAPACGLCLKKVEYKKDEN